MGRSVNKVIFLGRAGKNLRYTSWRTGTIVNLSLAMSERYRIFTATGRKTVEWHTTWSDSSGSAKILRDLLSQGIASVYRGRAANALPGDDRQTRQRRYRSEIVVTEISLLSPPPDGGSDDVEHYVSGQGFTAAEFNEELRSRNRKFHTDRAKLEIIPN